MLPIDFDPYDTLCRIQEEQANLRQSHKTLLKNQRELASAYNKLKDDYDHMAEFVNELKSKHNTLVNQHRAMEIKLRTK